MWRYWGLHRPGAISTSALPLAHPSSLVAHVSCGTADAQWHHRGLCVAQTPFRTKVELLNDTAHLGMQLLSEFAEANLGARL
eukprot:COSAG06_NODE_37184_length_438_cov_0.840708_1_plen_82_part_10